MQAYGKLPLHFEPNQGQIAEEAKFMARGDGYTLFLTANEMVLSLIKPADEAKIVEPHSDVTEAEGSNELSVVKMKLLGANESPEVVGVNKLAGKSNYFIGNDPDKWRRDVPHYGKVEYLDA